MLQILFFFARVPAQATTMEYTFPSVWDFVSNPFIAKELHKSDLCAQAIKASACVLPRDA